ncbi:MAG: GDSL-type esterase/lipase family protein [Candidatus Omnitrophica bacterium]|nr:GDSL-type esterase/lipase family protein [Candidatus Omnitrophota bacterium]MDD5552707.1 GDSL-type esterase/lipase family protein [Candidatus Omnitrophota bacterium]
MLEMTLRAGGYIYTRFHSSQVCQKPAVDTQEFNVLCIGDSYTYGLGASFEYSYPRQLEQLLKADGRGKKITVQNLGSPGGNSFRILKILRENIPKYNPHIVIVMVGMNNNWNLEGMERFRQKGILNSIKSRVYDLRLYKLWEILSLGWEKKAAKNAEDGRQYNATDPESEAYVEKMKIYKEKGQIDLALQETRNMLEKYPNSCSSNAQFALFLREAGDYDSAIQYAEKALKYAPDDPRHNAYIHLELLYDYMAKKDWGSAREEIDLVLPEPALIQSALIELKNICDAGTGLDFVKEAESLRESIFRIHGRKGAEILEAFIYLQKNREQKIKIIKEDLAQLMRISRENNIKMILMTYPHIDDANGAARKIASQFEVPLIDNEFEFQGRMDKEGLFNFDGHCNAKGYKLIATNLYSTLLNSGLLPEIKTRK